MGDIQTGTELPDRSDAGALSEFEFEEVATHVVERFSRVYHAVGNSDDYDEVSSGWWLVIKRMGLSLWIGKDKPAIESGDLLRINISKKLAT